MSMNAYNDALALVASSYVASNWLKAAAKALDGRDPVDALRDAELLAELAKKRIAAIMPVSTTKLCSNCHYHVPASGVGSYPRCAASSKRSPVDGAIVMGYCDFERNDNGKCGPDGKLFLAAPGGFKVSA